MNIPQMKLLAKHLPLYKEGHCACLQDLKGGFSIQGVMCDLYRRAKKGGAWVENPVKGSQGLRFLVESGPWCIDAPEEVVSWYGMTPQENTHLWELHASGYTFEQIARAIEKALEKRVVGIGI